MKRVFYDVPRWTIYQYRRAAGLPLVDIGDSREQRLADELFASLYTGQLDRLPEELVNADDALWASGCHGLIETSLGPGGLDKLRAECKGDAALAAKGTQALLDALPKGPPSPADSGTPPSGDTRDAADALDQVDVGDGWGAWKGEAHANQRAKGLAERLREDEKLRRIADLAGKFKRLMVSKQQTRVRRGADEISDVVQGSDLARLLPTELARLASPRYRLAALRDLMERKCLEYEMTSVELLGRGPLVLCLDKSPSMEGPADIWASAVALALLDMVHRQHRTFILLGFNDKVFYRKAVKPGRPLPEDALFVPLSGGTDIGKVLDTALYACERRDVMKRADIVLITDGASDTRNAKSIRQRAAARGVSIFGVGIGVPAASLTSWCDDVHTIEDLSGIDDEGATKLFGMSP